MDIRRVSFDHPDAVKLNDQVQAEYHIRYGDGGDATPLAPEDFEPPGGVYLLAYDETGSPVASGGWRAQDTNGEGNLDGDAELKRMYVTTPMRGRGLARRMLAVLEEDARAAGRTRMVLETGTEQPEAIALYTSSGYEPCGKFGHYRHHESSRCFAKPLGSPRTRAAGNAQAPADAPVSEGAQASVDAHVSLDAHASVDARASVDAHASEDTQAREDAQLLR